MQCGCCVAQRLEVPSRVLCSVGFFARPLVLGIKPSTKRVRTGEILKKQIVELRVTGRDARKPGICLASGGPLPWLPTQGNGKPLGVSPHPCDANHPA